MPSTVQVQQAEIGSGMARRRDHRGRNVIYEEGGGSGRERKGMASSNSNTGELRVVELGAYLCDAKQWLRRCNLRWDIMM